MTRMRKLLITAALLGVSAVSLSASSVPLRSCDTACPTSDGFCNCPTWTDKPGKQSFCFGWNSVSRAGCWYE
jgi:hypothetical protein